MYCVLQDTNRVRSPFSRVTYLWFARNPSTTLNRSAETDRVVIVRTADSHFLKGSKPLFQPRVSTTTTTPTPTHTTTPALL